ncbi:cell division protein ZapE [Pseudoalteromonas piscicida]|uniref:Cell division protein ZapE n=1 Tax=Pseudoalteromonas piscicida TaxID=43662 RepID=A0AAQ2IT99_PSEO7|nr:MULTISPECIES: cell division protein ZapE [Pseudoalteromonas]KJY86727.1 ATPase [Pseudoalteromonas piscicida]TMN43269.1 cell division protein ZapE [Pseudoalteromonas piscicida]TMN43583.1 cell division protein ZapE [Pseudoalteromonas piscicida]TMN48991.1 cell division protein ZapE [Pseudoalteromonas piscicida]TMN49215.1 cell division protein ZapE [Pseudoalteromonas piscicida]
MTPWEKYQQDLQRDDFQYDSAQENAVKHLQRLYDDLINQPPVKPNFFSRLFGKTEPPKVKGLYFWGGVGRGKTYLVDTFYDALPTERKMRVHFHRFMHRVHTELKKLNEVKNPLESIADTFKSETDIICFDEFFVQDITDAMLLGGLMQALFARGIVLVATSNIVPDDLYKNGLQRARFLPAIELVKANTEVVNVDSGIDYRLRTLEQAEIFHSPLDKQADEHLFDYFNKLSPEPGKAGQAIEIEGRMIQTRMVSDCIVMFDFPALCETARSQVDYMEISRLYNTVILSNVKQMGQQNDDAARRFIALVDEFYERNVTLIISAAAPITELYTEGTLNFEFKRCISRLQEMQSHEYLAREHLA